MEAPFTGGEQSLEALGYWVPDERIEERCPPLLSSVGNGELCWSWEQGPYYSIPASACEEQHKIIMKLKKNGRVQDHTLLARVALQSWCEPDWVRQRSGR